MEYIARSARTALSAALLPPPSFLPARVNG